MCRRPAIRSTSGLTTRAIALITRRVRGPKRIAFRAARGGAAGPCAEAGTPPARAAGETVFPRTCGVGIVRPPREPELSAALTAKDEPAGDNVTARRDGSHGSLEGWRMRTGTTSLTATKNRTSPSAFWRG